MNNHIGCHRIKYRQLGNIMLDNVCDYIVQWVEDNLDTGKNINDLIEDIGYSRKTV